ncbi:sialate O-acetylesterase [Paenibacillus eucommiae]|uniref:Sialate O-acetylesterase domain-containing protein n=1 Tax=Paenibacillus eucommiae TaxID=1355755 RepID=A0ABS4ILM4_9BACL|nr:sialate O-acetylesterase [Paenibacillus eucommiae]MBP1988444.1 hypothetical protein [Paenibacillus eucommiae]
MQIGAIIEQGPKDWQIIQQVDGKASITLAGIWVLTEPENPADPTVYARIVREETGETVIPWKASSSPEAGKWEVTIEEVPAGGLYRIETCFNHGGNKALEWATRGDMIHHIGVGDVYVITGQSNSAGYGKDPIQDAPEIGIHVLRNSGKWDLASHPLNESTNTIHKENREQSNPGHSPYLSFSKKLKKELGYPIGLIQASLGGSPLSAWNPEEDGYLYRNMMQILASQANSIKGVLWYQGCSDTSEEACDTYLERFKSMVAHLREDLNAPSLPILTVQLNRYVAQANAISDKCWGKVREAQRQAGQQIPDVYVIPSTDSGLSDAVHISSASNMVLGERLARTALKHVYGKGFLGNAPDLSEAKKVDADKVQLQFQHVSDRLFTFDVGADHLPFVVEDAEGFLSITSYEQQDAHSILITLDRALTGSCQVHGAFEQNPKAVIPIDFASHLPMLSFYGVGVID